MIKEEPKRLHPTQDTIRQLFAKSGNKCAFPECEQPLIDDEGIFVGQICHIEGVKGERFNGDMSNEARRSFDNLLLLCYPHHKKTDNVVKYPVDILRQIKLNHENKFDGKYTASTTVIINIYNELKDINENILEINQTSKQTFETVNKNSDTLALILERVTEKSTIHNNSFDKTIEGIEKLRAANQYKDTIKLAQEIREESWSVLNNLEKYKILANIGLSYLNLGDSSDAAKFLIDAVEFNPTSDKALSFAALGHAINKNFVETQHFFQKSLSINPKNVFAYVALIQVNQGCKILQEIIDEIPEDLRYEPEIAYAIGCCAKHEKNYTVSIKWLEIALEKSGNNANIKAVLAAMILESITDPFTIKTVEVARLQKSQIIYAIELLSDTWEFLKNVGLKDQGAHCLCNRGKAKLLLANKIGAYTDVKLSYETCPNSSFIIRNFALISAETGRYAEAIELLNELQNLADADIIETQLFKVSILFSLKQYNDAIAIVDLLQKGTLCEEDLQATHRYKLKYFVETNLVYDAIEYCSKLRETESNNANSYLLSAKVFKHDGQDEFVVTNLKKAIDFLDTSDKFLVNEIALELFYVKEYSLAADLFDKISEKSTYSSTIRKLIQCYYEMGETGKALNLCKNVNDKYGPIGFITQMQFEIYNSIDDLENATKICEEHLSVYPDDQYIIVNLAFLNAQKRNWDEVNSILSRFSIDENKIPTEILFKLAFLYVKISQHETGLELAYRTREKFLNDYKAHNGYYSFISQVRPYVKRYLSYQEVEVNTVITLTDDDTSFTYTILPKSGSKATELASNSFLAIQLLGRKTDDILQVEIEGQFRTVKVENISSKYLVAEVESLNRLSTDFADVSGFKTFQIGDTGNFKDDFKELFDQIDKVNEIDKKIDNYYIKRQATLSLIADRKRMNFIKAWSSFTSNSKIGIFSDAPYKEDDYESASRTIGQANGFVIDLISLLTLASLQQLSLIEKLEKPKIVARAAIDIITSFIHEMTLAKRQGILTIGKEGDEYVKNEITPDNIQSLIEFYEHLLLWVDKNCKILPCNEALQINAIEKSQLEDVFGRACIDAILLAKEHSYFLMSDEELIRICALFKYNIASSSSYMFFSYCNKHKLISDRQFGLNVGGLFARHYKHLPMNAHILIGCLEMSNYKNTFPFSYIVSHINSNYTDESAIKMFAHFIAMLFTIPERKETENVIVRIINAVIQNRSPIIVLDQLISKLRLFLKNDPHIVEALEFAIIRYGYKIGIYSQAEFNSRILDFVDA